MGNCLKKDDKKPKPGSGNLSNGMDKVLHDRSDI